MDMKLENLSAICSLITKRTVEIMKEFMVSQSRARFMAEDEVAASLTPPVTGSELSHWVAVSAGYLSQKKNGEKVMELPILDKHNLISGSGEAENDPFASRLNGNGRSSIRSQILGALGKMEVGQVKYIQATSLDAARGLQRNLSCLNEINKWKYHSIIDKNTAKIYIKRFA